MLVLSKLAPTFQTWFLDILISSFPKRKGRFFLSLSYVLPFSLENLCCALYALRPSDSDRVTLTLSKYLSLLNSLIYRTGETNRSLRTLYRPGRVPAHLERNGKWPNVVYFVLGGAGFRGTGKGYFLPMSKQQISIVQYWTIKTVKNGKKDLFTPRTSDLTVEEDDWPKRQLTLN